MAAAALTQMVSRNSVFLFFLYRGNELSIRQMAVVRLLNKKNLGHTALQHHQPCCVLVYTFERLMLQFCSFFLPFPMLAEIIA